MPSRALRLGSPAADLPGLTAAHRAAMARLRIATVADVVAALRAEKIRLPAIAVAYAYFRPAHMPAARAAAFARRLCAAVPAGRRCVAVGSLRRGARTVGDIDLITDAPLAAVDVGNLGGRIVVLQEFATGSRRRSMIVSAQRSGARPTRFALDIFHAPASEWGSALVHFTGGRDFNIRLRARARARGYTLSQHGARRTISGGKLRRFRTEKKLFEFFGYRWHAPNERSA